MDECVGKVKNNNGLITFVVSTALWIGAYIRWKCSYAHRLGLEQQPSTASSNANASSRRAKSLILVIDIGSSSLRCSPFLLQPSLLVGSPSTRTGHIRSTKIIPINIGRAKLAYSILANSNANTHNILEIVESNVRQILCDSISELDSHFGSDTYQIIAIGFSSLVMNICGVNRLQQQITPLFTYASACESDLTNNTNYKALLQRSIAELKQLISNNSSNNDNNAIMAPHRQTGTVVWHPSYAPAQLRCYSYQQEQGQGQVKGLTVCYWQSFSQYIIGKWTGVGIGTPMSLCEASWTGMCCLERMQWDPSVTEIAGITSTNPAHHVLLSSILPDLCQFDEFRSTIQKKQQLPQAIRSSHLFLGMGDGVCSCFGSYCDLQPKRYISVTIGTSAAVRVLVDLAHQNNSIDDMNAALGRIVSSLPSGLWCYRINGRYCVVGGALTDGGNLIEWYTKLVGSNAGKSTKSADRVRNRSMKKLTSMYFTKAVTSNQQLHVALSGQQVASATATTTASYQLMQREQEVGLPLILPFFSPSGERSTGYHSDATGSIHDITLATTTEDILFALMESICFRLKAILDLILTETNVLISAEEQTDTIKLSKLCDLRLVVSGSALETNRLWCQMLADITNITTIRLQLPVNQEYQQQQQRQRQQQSYCELTSFGLARLMSQSIVYDTLSDRYHVEQVQSGSNSIASAEDADADAAMDKMQSFASNSRWKHFYSRRYAKHQRLYAKQFA